MNVICFGDSNTWGYDPRSYFGGRYASDSRWVDVFAQKTGWKVINHGENGREIPRNAEEFPDDTDMVLIMLGTNDLLQGAAATTAAEKMEAFLYRTLRHCKNVALISPPALQPGEWVTDPALISESVLLVEKYRKLAEGFGILFVDSNDWHLPLAYDGVHFTEKAHRIFGDKIATILLNNMSTFSCDCKFAKEKEEIATLDCISVENMRISDAMTIEHYVPSLVLMYRAAYGVFQAVPWGKNAAIVVGSGNNGGDGFALACILREHGLPCCVFTVSQRYSQDSKYYADQAMAKGIPVTQFTAGCLDGYDIVVDCLLGTGFHGALRENYKMAIEAINSSNAFVVSVDINSGMNGDTGEAELAVISDLTVTIGYVKNGLIVPEAGNYMKRLVCTDIGIVLAYEENKLVSRDRWAEFCSIHAADPQASAVAFNSRYHFPAPAWLDWKIISSLG